ncbi:hypothetical protein ACFOG5_05615 [Pedobacter fastidiosus]|uniref:Addiction module component n=1 Tax=Pedobacter fastidiosus TaxID=2765361 RepID=A0ABR7KQZ2_9SPHI|nr:hypothetical protein [Pedobacter fastidiosus]MBC6110379.1 hypothetical protein [Pedobacter fastidiosus]
MELQVDIGFEQLVKLIKNMPEKQWLKLKQEVDEKLVKEKDREDYKKLLLSGPTFSDKQLEILIETRKSINEWREK